MSKKRRVGWFGLGAVFLTVLACSLSNPTPAAWVLTPTAEAAAAAATVAAKTRAAISNPILTDPAETPTITAQPSQTPLANTLKPLGPWLVYPAEEGRALIIRNADSSGHTRLPLPDPLLDAGDLTNGLAPQGGWLAVRTGRRQGWGDLAIQLIHLPDGSQQRLTPLLSTALEKDDLSIQSVVWRDSLRWSPDGHYLAFIAATDGTSSDLYVYDMLAKKIQRLTTGSYQAATPFWSPDSQWVITQEMSAITGSDPIGWKLEEVWAVNLLTQEFRKLYDPSPDSNGEIFMGWTDPQKMLFYSHSTGGWHDLRQIDLDKLKVTTLLAGSFNQIAFDPVSKTVAFTRKEGPPLPTGASPGLYQVPAYGGVPELAQAGDWPRLTWSGLVKTFIASGPQGTLVLPPGGKPVLYEGEPTGLPSPNNKWMACWGGDGSGSHAGLRLYQPGGQILQAILTDPVQDFTWAPDSTGLFALSNGRLYHFTFPDLKPAILEDGIHAPYPGGMGWISAEHH